jgi:hypothetical protein
MNEQKYYKVLSKDNRAQDGGTFDYSDYIPGGKLFGTPTPTITNTAICNRGYHLTAYWNMWVKDKDNKIYEVTPIGLVTAENDVGVNTKVVCSAFVFNNEVTPEASTVTPHQQQDCLIKTSAPNSTTK